VQICFSNARLHSSAFSRPAPHFLTGFARGVVALGGLRFVMKVHESLVPGWDQAHPSPQPVRRTRSSLSTATLVLPPALQEGADAPPAINSPQAQSRAMHVAACTRRRRSYGNEYGARGFDAPSLHQPPLFHFLP